MLDLINVLLGNKQEGNHWKQAGIQGSVFLPPRNGITVAWFGQSQICWTQPSSSVL